MTSQTSSNAKSFNQLFSYSLPVVFVHYECASHSQALTSDNCSVFTVLNPLLRCHLRR